MRWLVLALVVCMCCGECERGSLCLQHCWECGCRVSKPPVGWGSHSTYYTPVYSEVDLRFNKTRADVRRWLSSI